MRQLLFVIALCWGIGFAQIRPQLIGIQYLCPEYALHIFDISPNRTPQPPQKLSPTMPMPQGAGIEEQKALATHAVHARDTLIIRLYDVVNQQYLPLKGPFCELPRGHHNWPPPAFPPFWPQDTLANAGITIPVGDLLASCPSRHVALTPAEFQGENLRTQGYLLGNTIWAIDSGNNARSILGSAVQEAIASYYRTTASNTITYNRTYIVLIEIKGNL